MTRRMLAGTDAMLVLEIEYLTGVARLASDPADPAPDWPPQPDRIFSALVASWGAMGEPDEGRAALEWLEQQDPPRLWRTKQYSTRAAVDVYVPVNDPRNIDQLPTRRSRQKRTFQDCVLTVEHPHQLLAWDIETETDRLAALQVLAQNTSYLGHSASLVRMRFLDGVYEAGGEGLVEAEVRSAPHKGRLHQLKTLHDRHVLGDARARPRPSPIKLRALEAPETPKSVFSTSWHVLGHAGGDRPDLLAASAVARRLRDALLSAYPDPAPVWLSGHESNNSPAREPHLAILPMAFVGSEHATGRLMGLGIVLPRAIRDAWDDSTPSVWKERRAFEGAISSLCDDGGRIQLKLGAAGVWQLSPELSPSTVRQSSLRPQRYWSPSRIWSTVTPIALDRHLKGEDWRSEAADLVARACENIGLPEPEQVVCEKHSAVRGVSSAWPPGGAPKRPDWARPAFLKGRKLVHARIAFAEPVEGPVILGAGRFAGLGLCLPIPDRSDHE